MLCNIINLEAKQASNGNYYVNVVAQAENDPFAEELKYRMWCSEALATKLAANPPATIELRKARVEVLPFNRVDEEGVVSEKVYTHLSVVVRQLKDKDVDDATTMADKLRRQMIKDGLICDVTVDDFDGAAGDLPE